MYQYKLQGPRKKKRTSRTECYIMVKRNQRGKEGILAKESAEKKIARQNPAFKASEKEHQDASKQKVRKKPGVLAKECDEKKISKTKPRIQNK